MVSIYLNSISWKLISHRKKIGRVEIDLIFKTPRKQMVLLEVKSISSSSKAPYYLNHRWSYNQKTSFMKTVEGLMLKYPYSEIYGVLAFVEYNKINFYFMDEDNET